MDDKRSIFIFQPHPSLMQRCRDIVEEAGYRVIAATTIEEAIAIVEDPTLEALLIPNTQAGVELSQYVREFTACQSVLLALVDRDDGDRDAVIAQMDADGFLLQPFSTGTLQSVMSVSARLAHLRQELGAAQQESRGVMPHTRRLTSAISSRTGFYQFDVIKDLLVVEVRRAKRYGFPLSILMVGLDSSPALHQLKRPTVQREITGGLAVAIAKSIRDIDIPIHYADDRILVFLPHTDLAGAEEVGRRIKRRINRITYRGDGVTVQLTASVGVAGINAGESLTFSRLIKDASAALKAAQLKGGDRVMKRRDPGAPKP